MKVKKAKPRDPSSSSSSKPITYLDAVYDDPEVVEAWQRVAARIHELLPDLADVSLTPRGDPRPWFGRITVEDPELTVAEAAFNTARTAARQRYAHLRGAR